VQELLQFDQYLLFSGLLLVDCISFNVFACYAAVYKTMLNVPKEFIVQQTRNHAENRSEMACKLLFWGAEQKLSLLGLMATCKKGNSSSLGIF